MIAYAIEALALLAGLAPKRTIKAHQLSEILDIPPQYLSKVMTYLVKKRFIASVTGPNGGFSLAVEPDKVTLYRVIASLDALKSLEDDCVMGLGKCSSATPCALHNDWLAFKKRAVEQAQQLTLIDVSQVLLNKLRVRSNNAELTLQEVVDKTQIAGKKS